MDEFRTAIDIANRACQHIGVPRISTAQGFLEDSRAAQEIGFAYGKLRQAELQRNYWTFAIKLAPLRAIDTDTMILAASLYDASTTYFVGSIVADGNGRLWISNTPNNLNFEPGSTYAWDAYYGPVTVDEYDADLAYYAGELVYTTEGDGKNRVYLSLQSANEDDPETAAAWSATETYRKNQVVTRTAVQYMSLIDLNTGNDPALGPALWSAATTYAIGDEAGGSDGLIYESLINGNINHDPVLDDGSRWQSTGVLNPWTTVFVGGAGSLKWLQIGGEEFPNGVTLTTLTFTYPLGAGPASQSGSSNIYKLPAAFLRKAPQDPKAGSMSFLGAPSGRPYDDWLIESGYLITRDLGPIVLRFVADVTDVRSMHAMFCEGLGARIGFEVCESITQSAAKKSTIAQAYQRFMVEARLVDAIESGATEPAEDDYISCRA